MSDHRGLQQLTQLYLLPLLALLLLSCWAQLSHQQHSHMMNNPELDKIWQEFKERFVKRYSSSDLELKRRHIFEDHLELIREHNIEADFGRHTFRLGLTKFADWSREEFIEYLNLRSNATRLDEDSAPEVESEEPVAIVMSSGLLDNVDWVASGAVTPVKDQGSCGACYTFSATGALEGQLFLKTGSLISLSEQNILDCSTSQGNMGCNGGAIPYAFRYVQQSGGIDTEASYPYTGKQGSCVYTAANSGGSCTGYRSLPSGDESQLQQTVASVGPVSVAIDASTMQFYRSGVYSSSKCSSSNLNHAVLVVGYGTASNGQQYWKVKNSWGSRWGMGGYIELARNDNNMCGIASAAVYPTV